MFKDSMFVINLGRVEEALDTAAHLLQFWKKKEPFYVTTEYEEK